MSARLEVGFTLQSLFLTPFSFACVLVYRGDDTIKLYLWFETLRSQARHAGGDMVTHLGNHEWMNLLGATFILQNKDASWLLT